MIILHLYMNMPQKYVYSIYTFMCILNIYFITLIYNTSNIVYIVYLYEELTAKHDPEKADEYPKALSYMCMYM